MEKYNYLESMREDIREYIRDNYDAREIEEKLVDRCEWETELNDELWIADSVTGNASGSYYCNAWKAEEAITHNWDILDEALTEWGGKEEAIEKGAEWCDVTIRCFLLSQAIHETLDEIETENEEA